MNILLNMPFLGKKNHIVAVNKDNKVREYASQKEAALDLGVQPSNISAVVTGKCNTIKGYAFTEADTALDCQGRQKVLSDTRLKANSRSFYVVDSKGIYKKYPNQRVAAKELGIHFKDISLALASKRRTVGEYVFIYANDVEKVDENNTPYVDEEKLHKMVDKIKSKGKKTVYIINPDGTYKKCYTQTEAADVLGVHKEGICAALSGGRNILLNHIIVDSDTVETIDENGDIVVNEKKIKELVLEKEKSTKEKPLYLVNSDGTYKKYNGPKEAYTDLGYSSSDLNSILHGKRDNIEGKSFVFAYMVESLDDDGNIVLNEEILEETRKRANQNSIYAIYSDGSYRKFSRRKDAIDNLGISGNQVDASLNYSRVVNGMVLIHANDIEEKTKSGVSLIREVLEERIRIANKDAIYAVNLSDGEYKKYDSILSASKELNIKEGNIRAVLKGRVIKTSGYKFIYANSVEKINDDGYPVPDEELIREITEKESKKA